MRQRFLPFLLVLLAAAGGVLATRILITDLAVFDGGLVSGWLCGGTGRWDCNAVAAHESAWLAGLPLSLWGLLFYIVVFWLALGATLLPGEDRKTMAVAGAAVCAAAVAFDAYLGYVMVARVGSLCGQCLATYAINVLLAVGFGWLARSLPGAFSWRRLLPSWPGLGGKDAGPGRSIGWMKLAGTLALVAALGAAFLFGYTRVADSRTYSEEQIADFLERIGGPPEIDMARFDGQPSLGPANAPVTIALVGDFQCTFCRSLAVTMERLRRRYPDRMRMVFVNAPLDSDCNPDVPDKLHPRACWLAQAGECARRMGKFWEFHDLVYMRIPFPRVGRSVVLDHLSEIGIDRDALLKCVETPAAKAEVARDLALVKVLHMSTPSFVVNGILLRGGAPRWMVERIVAAALADSGGTAHARAENQR